MKKAALKTKAKIKLKLGQKIALSALMVSAFSLGLNFAMLSIQPNNLNTLNIKKTTVVKTKKVALEDNGIGMANPASVYCDELGYESRLVNDENGQYSECVFSEDSSCEEWDFLQGKCGKEYSYCTKQGYDQIIKTDGRNALTSEYAVCVTDKGKELGAVTNLSKVIEKSITGKQVISSEDLEKLNNEVKPDDVITTLDLPSIFDWRDVNGDDWMTPVRDQRLCGSCWAFAAVGTTEAAFNIASNNPNLNPNLSEQELVSCGDNGGCGGGWTDSAISYIKSSGIKDETCFPYSSIDDMGCNYFGCNLDPIYCSDKCTDLSSIKIDNYDYIPVSFPDVRAYFMKGVIANVGPINSSIQFRDENGYFDTDGVYRCNNESSYYTNHAVVLVGYNDIEEYWIVKNSWGSSWNEDGYYKLGYGECLVESGIIMYPYGINYEFSCWPGVTELTNYTGADLSDSEEDYTILGHDTCCLAGWNGNNNCVYQESCFNSHLPNEIDEIHAKVDDTYCEISASTNLGTWYDCDSSELACESLNYCNRTQDWPTTPLNYAWTLPGDFTRNDFWGFPIINVSVGEYRFDQFDQYECCGDDPDEYTITNSAFGETKCCDTATDYLDENGECTPCAKGGCVKCYDNTNCDDETQTTIDTCHSPGLITSYCVNTPSQELEEF